MGGDPPQLQMAGEGRKSVPHALLGAADAALHRRGDFVKGQFGMKAEPNGVRLDFGKIR